MNGMNKDILCDKSDGDEENEEEEELVEAGPSGARREETPQWNSATRELYEGNLKVAAAPTSASKKRLEVGAPRARLSSLTDSTSSDDSCVYMYKGGDDQLNGNNNVYRPGNCSSPEMDYLEMDFDPCQSNEPDSSDSSDSDVAELREEGASSSQNHLNPVDSNNDVRNLTPASPSPNPSAEVLEPSQALLSPLNSLSLASTVNIVSENLSASPQYVDEIHINVPEGNGLSNASACDAVCVTPELNNGSQCVPEEIGSAKLVHQTSEVEHNDLLSKHLLSGPSQRKASYGTDPCCLSTIIRAVNTLSDAEDTINHSHDDLPNSDLSITELLTKLSNGRLSVSKVEEIIRTTGGGAVTSRFFQAHPSILSNLSSWLHHWLKKDAVIVLCLNFHLSERACTDVVNPSWHYQLVHSVNSKGVQMFSPLETVSEHLLNKLFLNPSEVLILKDYVITHWTPTSSLKPLYNIRDSSWRQYNVLGQVVNVIRDTMTGKSDDEIRFVKVPSPHRTGILVIMRSDNIHLNELLSAEDTFHI